jgi:hypothetical protein
MIPETLRGVRRVISIGSRIRMALDLLNSKIESLTTVDQYLYTSEGKFQLGILYSAKLSTKGEAQ